MGIRYVAAVSVVIAHLGWLPTSTAVPMFFFLSGFILAFKYTRTDQGLTMDARRFWLARFSRLYPSHLLALLLLVLMRVIWGIPFVGEFGSLVASVLMINGWLPRYAPSWNVPSWTNTCEMFFYLCFPLLAVPVSRLRSRRTLMAAMGVMWLAGLAMTWAVSTMRPDVPTPVDWWSWFVKFNPVLHLPEFVMGMLLGRWYSEWGCHPNRVIGSLLSGGGAIIAIALSVYPLPYYIYQHNTLLVPVFALMTWGLLMGGGLADLFATRPLVALGYASYALYIVQDPVLISVNLKLGWDCFSGQPSRVFLAVAGLTVLSLVIHRFVEEPAMAFLRRRMVPLAGGDAHSSRMAIRDSLLALVVTATLVLEVSLLPQHRLGLATTRLEEVLSAIDAPRVAWVEGGDEEYLKRYEDRVRGTRFVRYRSGVDAEYVLAPPKWTDPAYPRLVEAEDLERVTLWCRTDASLPLRYRVVSRDPFGNAPADDVGESGFHGVEHLPNGQTFRWTNGQAALVGRTPSTYIPRHLEIRLAATCSSPLEIKVDGVVIWSGTTSGLDQTIVAALRPAPLGAKRRIELLSPSWVPHERVPASGDLRPLGVPVYGFRWLH